MRTTLRRRRGEEGGAVVETALLLIILVPLILFTMYMGDAGRHLLDVQEAVLVTTWDLSQQSYSNLDELPAVAKSKAANFIDGTIAAYERVQYADHDGGYSGEKGIGGDGKSWTGKIPHTTAFAQVSWCNGGNCDGNSDWDTKQAAPVHCGLEQFKEAWYLSVGASNYALFASAGGVATCRGKAWLYNYLVPQHFLRGFGQVDDAKMIQQKQHKEKNPDQISGDAQVDLLLKERAALLVDTWAVGDASDIKRSNGLLQRGTGPNKAFFNRTQIVFSTLTWYTMPAARVVQYATRARSNKLANIIPVPEVPDLPVGPNAAELDNPAGLAMSAKYEDGKNPNINSYKDSRFFTTPLYDQAQSMYESRGSWYLGMKNAEQRQ